MLVIHRNYAVKMGAFLGVSLFFVTLFLYFFSKYILFETRCHSVIFLAIVLIYTVYLLMQQNVGLSTFKEFFSVIFLFLVSAYFIYALFTYFLYDLSDLDVIGVYGLLPAVQLSSDILDLNNNEGLHDFSLKSQLNSYIFSLIPCTLYAALISLLMKIRTLT